MHFARALLLAAVVGLAVPQPALASDADAFYRDVKAGNDMQAIENGSRYLATHPNDSAFALDLAYAYLKIDDLDTVRSIMVLRGAYLEAHPTAATIWLALSYQDSEEKDYRAAIADVDRYLRFHPDDTAAWQQRGYAAAAITAPPPDVSAAFYSAVTAKQYGEAIPLGVRYLSANPQNGAFAVDLAYAYLSAKDLPAATALANTYATFISSDKNGSSLLAALFYAWQSDGDDSRALSYGRKYLALHPDEDAFAMDLTYAELKEGNLAEARAIVATRESYLRAHPAAAKVWLDFSYRDADAKRYAEAIADVDTYLSIQPDDSEARAQRAAYAGDRSGGPRQSMFGYTYYDSRFDDTFLGVDQTYALSSHQRVQLYIAGHLGEDMRSGAPGTPQIYSDDALITDLGVRGSLTPNITAFAEAGFGIGLRGQGTITDARYGVLFGHQWGGLPHDMTTVDASVAVYSRYAGNTIAYYNVLHVFPGRHVRPLLGLNGGLDSHSVFGNNFVEGIYGLQAGNSSVSYRLVGVEGEYLTRGTIRVQPAYSGLRAMLVFGVSK